MLQNGVMHYVREKLLSDSRKKTLVDRQGCRGVKTTCWTTLALTYVLCLGLQLWGGHVFQSDGSRQDRGPRKANEGVRVDKMRLGPDDVNLQTEELHYNYSVLIASPE